MSKEPKSLKELLDRVGEAASNGDRVSLSDILDEIGYRSFGPMLLMAGVIILIPLTGGIPGVPVLVGFFVLLVAVQMLLQRPSIWMPQWLLDRSIASKKVRKGLSWTQRPARFIDKIIKRRLSSFTAGPMKKLIAPLCILVAAAMPLTEVVPFSATLAGLALATFGLALVAQDGLLNLIGMAVTVVGITFLVWRVVT
jgi:hypothetical protein